MPGHHRDWDQSKYTFIILLYWHQSRKFHNWMKFWLQFHSYFSSSKPGLIQVHHWIAGPDIPMYQHFWDSTAKKLFRKLSTNLKWKKKVYFSAGSSPSMTITLGSVLALAAIKQHEQGKTRPVCTDHLEQPFNTTLHALTCFTTCLLFLPIW